MTSPQTLLARLAENPGDQETARALGRLYLAWIADGPNRSSLAAALGEPDTPDERRRERDAYLRRAAYYVRPSVAPSRGRHVSSGLDRRVSALRTAIRDFLARRWGAWQRLPAPPSMTNEVEAQLFYAARYGELPCGRVQLKRILAPAFSDWSQAPISSDKSVVSNGLANHHVKDLPS